MWRPSPLSNCRELLHCDRDARIDFFDPLPDALARAGLERDHANRCLASCSREFSSSCPSPVSSDFPSFLWLLAYVPHVRYPSPLPAPFNARTTVLGDSLIFTRRNITSPTLHEVKSWAGALATPIVHGLCRCISYQYAGRSAQKIISRARCNPLARTCQSPRTKLVGRLARFVLQVARISHPLHEDPNSSWGGFPTLPRTKPKVGGFFRQFLHYLEVVSRRYIPFFQSSELTRDFPGGHPTWTHISLLY